MVYIIRVTSQSLPKTLNMNLSLLLFKTQAAPPIFTQISPWSAVRATVQPLDHSPAPAGDGIHKGYKGRKVKLNIRTTKHAQYTLACIHFLTSILASSVIVITSSTWRLVETGNEISRVFLSILTHLLNDIEYQISFFKIEYQIAVLLNNF